MGQMEASGRTVRHGGIPMTKAVVVAVLGLTVPLFVSAPLSAADTRIGTADGGPAVVAQDQR
jgi:hypothetical protein